MRLAGLVRLSELASNALSNPTFAALATLASFSTLETLEELIVETFATAR